MGRALSSKKHIETQLWIFKATGSANKQYNRRIKMIQTLYGIPNNKRKKYLEILRLMTTTLNHLQAPRYMNRGIIGIGMESIKFKE